MSYCRTMFAYVNSVWRVFARVNKQQCEQKTKWNVFRSAYPKVALNPSQSFLRSFLKNTQRSQIILKFLAIQFLGEMQGPISFTGKLPLYSFYSIATRSYLNFPKFLTHKPWASNGYWTRIINILSFLH